MINGQIGQWITEAHQHWGHILAAGGAIKSLFPIAEIVRLVVVALTTAFLTSSITIAKLEERIISIKELLIHMDQDHREFDGRLRQLERHSE